MPLTDPKLKFKVLDKKTGEYIAPFHDPKYLASKTVVISQIGEVWEITENQTEDTAKVRLFLPDEVEIIFDNLTDQDKNLKKY